MQETATKTWPVPVTILTGFLGAGKTTLLNRILSEHHGGKIAVIENELGEAGIDNELLYESKEQIVAMNNGCICCTVRGVLVRILNELAERRVRNEITFDRVIIETTGLADPAPVAQTFFVEQSIVENYLLDAVITVVDAKHGMQQLDTNTEAQEQVGFADRILISKTDLVGPADVHQLKLRLRTINPRAPISVVHFGATPVQEILDIRGFNLSSVLEVAPDFLDDVTHEHDNEIKALIYKSTTAFDLNKLSTRLQAIIEIFGPDLPRYKGLLSIAGRDRKFVFQGVHMLMTFRESRLWMEDEPRKSIMVFIGRSLPRDLIIKSLRDSHHDTESVVEEGNVT